MRLHGVRHHLANGETLGQGAFTAGFLSSHNSFSVGSAAVFSRKINLPFTI